ncbi:MAG: hypothetical protein JKY65_27795 [Planctomycetes bacterium]|nr:hypothetical protein [Planctomycetota bacterium]
MSDELIRALAPQWASSHEDEDGVAYLRAQLRAGTLSEESGPSHEARTSDHEAAAGMLFMSSTPTGDGHSHPLTENLTCLALREHLPIVFGPRPFTASLRVAELMEIASRWLCRRTDPPAAAELVWAGIRREVVPWALAYSDPVRERVEARQR